MLNACKAGYEDFAVKYLSIDGVEVNATDYNGHDAFYWALKNDLKPVVEAMESLVDKNAVWRKNALLEACEAKDQNFAVKLLSIDGVDLNATGSEGLTPFFCVCRNNSATVAQAMVNEPEGIDFNWKSSSGSSSFGFKAACYNGHIEVVKILVENSQKLGIDLNIQDELGYTGLMWACAMKKNAVVDFLLANSQNYNINLDIRNFENKSAKDEWPEKFSESA